MADSPRLGQSSEHLDPSGARDVVYCHQCDHEWYQDDDGLTCPRCSGEVTEIVTPESDPRPIRNGPSTPPEFTSLRNHYPWQEDDNSDPEEADIEEHVTHGPGGSVVISRTIRTGGAGHAHHRRRRNDPDNVMRDFQTMVGNLMGPGFRPGQAGRSGQHDLFPPRHFGRLTSAGPGGGPHFVGGTFTYTSGPGLRPRNADGPQDGRPPVDDLATILGSLFGPLPGEGPHEGARNGMPPGLAGLFSSLLNPANARHGDAVYSQEALDQIISTLMEQHPTSNAPGPASPDAIAALPKKKLDEKILGPEGKGECSVCMDDVTIGDEVVHLPCSHWFHETCASAWLSEHNTCPICRKGIEAETPPPTSRRSSQTSTPVSRHDHRSRRLSLGGHLTRENTISRNEARLNSIRNAGMLSPQDDGESSRRYTDVRESLREARGSDTDDYIRRMPGSYRRRDSEMSIDDDQRISRRVGPGGGERLRDSRRSSHSGNGGGSSSSGAMSWLRDRWNGSRRHD